GRVRHLVQHVPRRCSLAMGRRRHDRSTRHALLGRTENDRYVVQREPDQSQRANVGLLRPVLARLTRTDNTRQHGRDDHQPPRRLAIGAQPLPRSRPAGTSVMSGTLVASPRDVRPEHKGAVARSAIGWGAVVVTLTIAVLSALQSDSGGFAVTISTLAGN